MAEILKEYLDQAGAKRLVDNLGTREDTKDAATLKSAKAYADSLSDNYDPAGTAQSKVEELEQGQVKTNKEAIAKLNGSNTTEGSVAKAVKDASDEIKGTIGTVTAGKTVVEMIEDAKTAATYDDTKIKSDIAKNTQGVADNKTAIDKLNGTGAGSVAKAVSDAKTELEGKIKTNTDAIGVLNGEDTVDGSVKKQIKDAVKTASDGLQSQVTANKEVLDKLNGEASVVGSVKEQVKTASDALDAKIAANTAAINAHKDAVDAKVTTLVGDDANKSVRTIANEELTKQLIPDGAKESLDTLQEIATWIQNHPDDASAMNQAITKLETLVGTIPKGATATDIVGYIKELVDAEKTRATGVEGGLETRLAAAEKKLGDGDGSVSSLIATAKQEAIDAAAADATTKANTAESNANTHADTKVKELADGQVATNKTNIETLRTDVDALKDITWKAITTEQIDAMFTTAEKKA